MSESTPSGASRFLQRDFLVHSLQYLVAFVVACVLTVVAIWLGWLPLCHKAAGLAALGGTAVLLVLVELARRRPWRE